MNDAIIRDMLNSSNEVEMAFLKHENDKLKTDNKTLTEKIRDLEYTLAQLTRK